MSVRPQPDAVQQPLSPLSVLVETSIEYGGWIYPQSSISLGRKFDLLQDGAESDNEEEHNVESDSVIDEQPSSTKKQSNFADKSSEDIDSEFNDPQPSTDLPIDHGASNYKPLNYAISSIRLLRIQPDTSPEGYIQCTLQHATVDEEYTCLSYVWGPPDPGEFILLDGRHHKVRETLLNFLEMARARHTDKLLWIDALCIDQDNDIERNHQVQQMGDIFSQANNVLTWLGATYPSIEVHLAWINKRATGPPVQESSSHQRLCWSDQEWSRHFEQSPYWQRAWVTQEALLARRLTLCAGQVELDARLLRSLCKNNAIESLPNAVHELIIAKPQVKRTGLIELIHKYRSKSCYIARDRIYSLLSICREGSALQVDYQASTEDVLLATMRSCPRSLCFCSVTSVASALGYDYSFKAQQLQGSSAIFIGWVPDAQVWQSHQPTETCSIVPHIQVGRLFVQLLAKKVALENASHRCWNCRYSWDPPEASGLPVLVVCLYRECSYLKSHLVVTLTSVNSFRVRDCILVSRCGYKGRELVLNLSEVGLTPAENDTYHLCVSLACVRNLAPARVLDPNPDGFPGMFCSMYRERSERQEDHREEADRMQFCDHDSHGVISSPTSNHHLPLIRMGLKRKSDTLASD
jgi:hypothetical protein